MDEIIRSRKLGGLTPDDRRRAEAALAALKAVRAISVVSTVVVTAIMLFVIGWSSSGRLAASLPWLAAVGLAMLIIDVVVVAIVWRSLDRQRRAYEEDIAAGQVEEIICLLPGGYRGQSELMAACNLPTGTQPGAGQATHALALALRDIAPGRELRLRILSGCRYLLSAEPC